jgi:hypothetical protein
MSDDDPEIIPPSKHGSIAVRPGSNVSMRVEGSVPPSLGAVGSVVSGFVAKLEARTYGEIAKRLRAQGDALDAFSEREDAGLRLRRKLAELDELPEILAEDGAGRQADRQANQEARDEAARERKRKAELAELRHQREVAEAERAIFNAKQGLENQQRLKELNSEIWQTRKRAEALDAEKVLKILRGADRPNESSDALDALKRVIANVEGGRAEIAADGGDPTPYDQTLALLAGELEKKLRSS